MAEAVPAITLHDVTLAHGERRLIEHADLRLAPGRLTVLAGANGHGKTTLLRALLGLHTPLAGRIEIFGHAPRKARCRIGYMPQDRRLPAPQMSGRALVSASWRGTTFGLPAWGRAIDASLHEALSLTDALDLAAQPVGQLSGGERQRLFLAGAMLEAPPLLVLDEPLGGMDTAWQDRILSMLRRRCDTTGMAVLMSCHGVETVLPFADHLLRIEGNTLELDDAAL